MIQHFLSLLDLSENQAQTLIQRAIELKAKQKAGEFSKERMLAETAEILLS